MARSAYRVQDWDQLKVQALKQHVKTINPFIKIVAYAGDIFQAPAELVTGLSRRYGTAIVAVDDIRVHESLNAMWYPRIEVIYTYVTDNGNAGEIVRTRPGESGCVRCLTNIEARRRAGIATAFQALGLDFHRVAMEAACVTLGILLRGKRGGELFGEYVMPSAHLFMVLTRRHGALAEALPEGFLNGTVGVDTRGAGLRCPVCGG